ncbi:hypothetical protein, partial [Treponema endosymbiont of Eucomonympha sp.]|uniref:hypothetical protein n=1 Tax=Treponema endosymbiont of Eucomonympha sp. TaxID=1580831 RepID=UPI00164F40FD
MFEFNSVTGWVKFGDTARVQAGKVSSRSVNRRTADINDYTLGVFFPYGLEKHELNIYQPGSYFHIAGTYGNDSGPQKIEGDLLKNGVLTSLYAGPATFDLLFAPNIDLKVVSTDEKARSYLYGARAAAQIGDAAKVTATFKQERAPGTASKLAALPDSTPTTGSATIGSEASDWLSRLDNTRKYDNTFGVFAEIDPVPEVGITVGYTGYLPVLDVSDTKWGEFKGNDSVKANHKSTL